MMLRKTVVCTYPIRFLQDKLHGIMTGDFIMFAGGTGCHDAGTPIMMANGMTKSVETVRVGDYVMGDEGTPRRVLNLVRGIDQFYKIHPVKGDAFQVNGDHILHCWNSRKHTFLDLSVREYLSMSATEQRHLKLVRCGGVKVFLNASPVLVDAYFLGLLLGDGYLRGSVTITASDPEIIAYCENQAQKWGLILKCYDKSGTHSKDYRFVNSRQESNPLMENLRKLGVWDKIAHDKFIPDRYKYNHRKVRLEILAGLLDTDGYARNGGYDYVTKSHRLAEDVVFVARSLGLAAYCTPKKVSRYGVYYRVILSGDCSIIPCRVKRKKVAPRKQRKSVLVTGFSVESTEIKPFYGFNISGNRLYLTGDFTVHHNCGKSTISRIITQNAIYQSCPVVLYSLEDEKDTFASDSVYREAVKAGCELDFREWLVDNTIHPDKYRREATVAAQRAMLKDKELGVPMQVVHEMQVDKGWNVRTILESMAQEADKGYRLFILDHLDVLVPSEKPDDMVRAINALWKFVSDRQIAMITFSQLATRRNREALCPSLDDLRGSKSKVHTPTIVISFARHTYGWYNSVSHPDASPTYCRVLKNRQGGKLPAAICFFERGHYLPDYTEVECNESGTYIDGMSMRDFKGKK